MSPTTRRLADLFAKHHFLLNGLGWGGMPLHVVQKNLDEGRLSVLAIEDVPPGGLPRTMFAVWQTKPPGAPHDAGRYADRVPAAETRCHQPLSRRRIRMCDLSV
jgi:DNA-binding transcriptional LysR family regulator